MTAVSISEKKRVLMAKDLAAKWLKAHSQPEYRMTIYHGSVSNEIRNLPRMLKAFRDDKVRIAGVEAIQDMGISTGFDSISVWSSNREGLMKIQNWLEKRGYETSGVW